MLKSKDTVNSVLPIRWAYDEDRIMILWIAHSLHTRPYQEKLSNIQFRYQAINKIKYGPYSTRRRVCN